MKWAWALAGLTAATPLVAPPLAAQPAAPSASAPQPNVAGAGAPGTDTSVTCLERIPSGKAPPKLVEKIAARATSGHAHLFEIVVEHGPGETVMPGGARVDMGGEAAKALEAARLFVPDPEGGAAPSLTRKEAGGKATTTVRLYFVPLPEKPGRNELVLPPLPITVARASGELMTLCTEAHALSVEDPIANLPNPAPKKNPAARRQLEEWTTAKHVTYAGLAALALGALSAWLVGRWLRRPRAVPPPPPPRPPGEIALEALFDLRHSNLLKEQYFAEFFDRVSDVVRRYLGDRFGYDGLESTTREALAALREAKLPMEVWVLVQTFMHDADLVKFARRAPTEAECREALDRAEAIVLRTPPDPIAPPAPAPVETEPEAPA